MKNILFILVFSVSCLFGADDISFTQKAQLKQQRYHDIQKASKELAHDIYSKLPSEAFDKNGKLKKANPYVVESKAKYQKELIDIKLRAQSKYNNAINIIKTDSITGVNALREELKTNKQKIFEKYESQLQRDTDGIVDKNTPHYKELKHKMEVEINAETKRINEIDAKDRIRYIKENLPESENFKYVGDIPSHVKSDLDGVSLNDKEFRQRVKGSAEWYEDSDRWVNRKRDITVWKNKSSSSNLKKNIGQSSYDAEMAFGAQHNSDSFPSTDGKKYAAGEKDFNKHNANSSNQVKYVHSYNGKTADDITMNNIDTIDTKTLAKSTKKSVDVAQVKVDENFDKQLKGLKDGGSIEEALDMFGDTKQQKDEKLKDFLANSKDAMAQSYEKTSKLAKNDLDAKEKKYKELVQKKADPKKIKAAETKLINDKLLMHENTAILSELTMQNPKLVGEMVSKEVEVIPTNDGNYYDVDKKRNLSLSEIKENIMGDISKKNAKNIQVVDVDNSSLFGSGKKKIAALQNSRAMKLKASTMNVLDLALGTVKAAEKAVLEEKEGDWEGKTWLKTLYYIAPADDMKEMVKSTTKTSLDAYNEDMKNVSDRTDTFTIAKTFTKNASKSLYNMGGSFLKGMITSFYDSGADSGKYLEKATRSSLEESKVQESLVMEKRLATYNSNKLAQLYKEASDVNLDDKNSLNNFNDKLDRYIKIWSKRDQNKNFSQRALALQNTMLGKGFQSTSKEVNNNKQIVVDDDPFADDSSDNLFAEADTNKAYELKQHLERNKQKEKEYVQSQISSNVQQQSEESRRKWAAIRAAAQEAQVSLQKVAVQFNEIRAQEKAEDRRYKEIAANNRAMVANMNKKQYDYSKVPKKSANGYAITDPYAYRFASKNKNVQVKNKSYSNNVKIKNNPTFVQPAKTNPKPVKKQKLWAKVSFKFNWNANLDTGNSSSAVIIDSCEVKAGDKSPFTVRYKKLGNKYRKVWLESFTATREVNTQNWCSRENKRSKIDLLTRGIDIDNRGFGIDDTLNIEKVLRSEY